MFNLPFFYLLTSVPGILINITLKKKPKQTGLIFFINTAEIDVIPPKNVTQ